MHLTSLFLVVRLVYPSTLGLSVGVGGSALSREHGERDVSAGSQPV